jgi:hypothetical protein
MLAHTVNIRFQIILLGTLMLLAGEAALTAEPETVHFTARVDAITPLTQYSGRIRVLEPDPRFALSLEILEVHPDAPDFPAKQTFTFAIHSPAHLFATADTAHIIGRTFDFTIKRTRGDDDARYSALSAVAHK